MTIGAGREPWRGDHGEFTGSSGECQHFTYGGSGRRVVLLHGWPGYSYDWRHVVPLLAGSYEVVAPDFRGFGRSGLPDGPPTEVSGELPLAQDVSAGSGPPGGRPGGVRRHRSRCGRGSTPGARLPGAGRRAGPDQSVACGSHPRTACRGLRCRRGVVPGPAPADGHRSSSPMIAPRSGPISRTSSTTGSATTMRWWRRSSTPSSTPSASPALSSAAFVVPVSPSRAHRARRPGADPYRGASADPLGRGRPRRAVGVDQVARGRVLRLHADHAAGNRALRPHRAPCRGRARRRCGVAPRRVTRPAIPQDERPRGWSGGAWLLGSPGQQRARPPRLAGPFSPRSREQQAH